MKNERERANNQDENKNHDVWSAVKAKLSEYLSSDAFSRWFKNAELIEDDPRGQAVIGVKSDMQQIWIETNYLDEVRAAFAEGAGIHDAPVITVLGDSASLPVKQVARGKTSSEQVKVVRPEEEQKTASLQRKLKRLGINPEFDFDSFVVGDNSQFAHAACSAVASREGRSFNPLFIHGRAGLGKTHLMSAIAQQLIVSDPKAKVVFL
ncbi:MAG: DnaA/Hda family protein, partial [Akkermansiaceae bacterium]